jgi:hypothetical protein
VFKSILEFFTYIQYLRQVKMHLPPDAAEQMVSSAGCSFAFLTTLVGLLLDGARGHHKERARRAAAPIRDAFPFHSFPGVRPHDGANNLLTIVANSRSPRNYLFGFNYLPWAGADREGASWPSQCQTCFITYFLDQLAVAYFYQIIIGTASARTSDPGASHRTGSQPSDFKMFNRQPLDLKSAE